MGANSIRHSLANTAVQGALAGCLDAGGKCRSDLGCRRGV